MRTLERFKSGGCIVFNREIVKTGIILTPQQLVPTNGYLSGTFMQNILNRLVREWEMKNWNDVMTFVEPNLLT